MTNWKRYAPGLYVDDTQTLVITSEDTPDIWSIRRLFSIAALGDGRPFPEYSSRWSGDATSYREAKEIAGDMIADMISRGEQTGPLGERPWGE